MDEMKQIILHELNDPLLLFFYDLLQDEDIKDDRIYCICELSSIYHNYYSSKINNDLLFKRIDKVFKNRGFFRKEYSYFINKEYAMQVLKEYIFNKHKYIYNNKVLKEIKRCISLKITNETIENLNYLVSTLRI